MYKVPKVELKYFEFQLPGNKKVYKMPLMESLPIGLVTKFYKLADKSEMEAYEFMVSMFNNYFPGIEDELNSEQFGEVIKEYLVASGLTVGE